MVMNAWQNTHPPLKQNHKCKGITKHEWLSLKYGKYTAFIKKIGMRKSPHYPDTKAIREAPDGMLTFQKEEEKKDNWLGNMTCNLHLER